jgi:hypothetical protein
MTVGNPTLADADTARPRKFRRENFECDETDIANPRLAIISNPS